VPDFLLGIVINSEDGGCTFLQNIVTWHAVVLFGGSKGRYLVTTRHGTMDVSLESVPRKCLLYGLSPGYISQTMRQQLELARGAIRVVAVVAELSSELDE
jgi:hypothetical protein